MKTPRKQSPFTNAVTLLSLGFWRAVHRLSRLNNQLTIKPRSKGSLGFAQYLPKESHLYSKEELLDQIAVILGGRCAEIEFFGKCTTGASDDLQKARDIAFDIVTTYGMSQKMKFIRFKYDEYGNKVFSEKTHQVN